MESGRGGGIHFVRADGEAVGGSAGFVSAAFLEQQEHGSVDALVVWVIARSFRVIVSLSMSLLLFEKQNVVVAAAMATAMTMINT